MGFSLEHFGFISGRKITDAIGITQEASHKRFYIQSRAKKCSDFILKLDLNKAYDNVHWDMVRLILLQTGLPLDLMNWITAYTSIANLAVLINDVPFNFFKISRGL